MHRYSQPNENYSVECILMLSDEFVRYKKRAKDKKKFINVIWIELSSRLQYLNVLHTKWRTDSCRFETKFTFVLFSPYHNKFMMNV